MGDTFCDTLSVYIRAAFPIIHINSSEYDRVFDAIVKCCGLHNIDYSIFLYDASSGLYRYTSPKGSILCSKVTDVENAVKFLVSDERDNAILVIKNLEGHIDSPRKWRLIDLLLWFYQIAITNSLYIIDIGPHPLCRELSNYVVSLDFNLPGFSDIKNIISTYAAAYGITVDDAVLERACELCQGMSQSEIEGAVALSLVSKDCLDLSILQHEKASIVRKSGLLEWIQDVPDISQVGGLQTLKEWFSKIAKAYSSLHRAKEFGLAIPKGCLLVGIPGTGKTLSAKAISSLFGVPLYRLDIGRLYSSFVGETERNVRYVFSLIDALAPCVVLIDEVEKSFAGVHSSGLTDSGTTARVFGSFLYYMQEKQSPAFFVCTANDISKLPPEFARRGRFDEIWYIGLPDDGERRSIWEIHLSKVKRDPSDFDLKALSNATDGFTGAEIERIIQEALYNAYYRDSDISTDDLLMVIQDITPLSVVESERIRQIIEWAERNSIRQANGSVKPKKKSKSSKVRYLRKKK